jgi:hypothetical protein
MAFGGGWLVIRLVVPSSERLSRAMVRMLSTEGARRHGDKAASNEARTARLAAALKSNLRRRKAQARERATGGEAEHVAKGAAMPAGNADHTLSDPDASHESARIVWHESRE